MKLSPKLSLGTAAFAAVLSVTSPSLAAPCSYYGAYASKCPEDGFGSRTPVHLPPDKQPGAGKDTGLPVANIPGPHIPSPAYFRPR